MSPAPGRSSAFNLVRVFARDFRNLAQIDFSPAPRFNVIFGDNGEGKSNLLELVEYLASLRSFRNAGSEEMVRKERDVAEISAVVADDTGQRTQAVRIPRKGTRRHTLNGKRPRSRHTYLSSLQTVLFHPGSLQLVSGAPVLRRDYMDRLLDNIDPTYGSTSAAYQRALRSRNRLLSQRRETDRKAVVAYNELLASAGAIIGQARGEIVRAMVPRVREAFRDFGGEKGLLSVTYRPRVNPEVSSLLRALEQSFSRDLERGFTTEGPHADELELGFDGRPAKHNASQGQHRSIVLALKIAELRELETRAGRVPILLLDDVSSELDRNTNRRLFSYLGLVGAQVFLTTTHPEFILLDNDRSDFSIREGRLTTVG
jgi:DNA replication and repair protein RecF